MFIFSHRSLFFFKSIFCWCFFLYVFLIYFQDILFFIYSQNHNQNSCTEWFTNFTTMTDETCKKKKKKKKPTQTRLDKNHNHSKQYYLIITMVTLKGPDNISTGTQSARSTEHLQCTQHQALPIDIMCGQTERNEWNGQYLNENKLTWRCSNCPSTLVSIIFLYLKHTKKERKKRATIFIF